MSLVSGPGRGGGAATNKLSDEPVLAIDRHVEYIQKLDSVGACKWCRMHDLTISPAQG